MEAEGAQFLTPTNEWEVLRYRFDGSLHIIYKNKHNRLTYTGDSLEHVMSRGGREVMQTPAKRNDKGSSPSHASTPIATILKGWPSATDTSCSSASDSNEPKRRREPTSDNSEERPPWEE